MPREALAIIADHSHAGDGTIDGLARSASARMASLWRKTREYYSVLASADASVGHILGALDRSGHVNATVLITISDHGYHLGEKLHWSKWTLWERTSRVPFFLSVPPNLVSTLPHGTQPGSSQVAQGH